MQTHKPTNPNAASAPPVARPLSDFSLLAQFEREVKPFEPERIIKDPGLKRCSKCGEVRDKAEGFYFRQSKSKSHKEGSVMQPCKTCRKEDSRLNRIINKEKQNDGC